MFAQHSLLATLSSMQYSSWLLLGGVLSLATYVHRTCVSKLGPNAADNTVRSVPAHPAGGPLTMSAPLLLVVLGWGGSTAKQLRRIVSFCSEQLGCPCIAYINPMLQYLHGSLDQKCIHELLVQIQSQLSAPAAHGSSPPSGFVVFAHSNNGSFVYAELKKHFQDPSSPFYPLRTQLRGVVYDSAPMLLSPQPAGKAAKPNILLQAYGALRSAVGFSFPSVAIILGRATYVHPFWTPAIVAWVACFKLALSLKKHVFGSGNGGAAVGDDTRRQLADGLQKDVPAVPHLFLYSKGDKLLPSTAIESYIAFLRTHYPSLHVRTHDFVTTGHVQHFLRAQDEYTRQLHDFLDYCAKAALAKRALTAAQRQM